MHGETVQRLSRLVEQQAVASGAGFAGDFDAGIPPITRFQSVDDVERIANNLELASGSGMTAALVEMAGVFYELALNAVEHSQWAAGYYVIRDGVGDVTDNGGHRGLRNWNPGVVAAESRFCRRAE